MAEQSGFTQVSLSHEVSLLIKFVGRGNTAVVDAYLSPILRRYVDQVANGSFREGDLLNFPKLVWLLWAAISWAISTLPLVMLIDPTTLIYGVIFDLPIAFLCCWTIGASILNRLMRHEITLGRAAFWGGLIALLFSLLWTAVERFRGWQASLDPSRSTNFSGGTGFNGGFVVTEFNGILTTYGWLMVCLLYTSPSPRDQRGSRMPSSA